tara:strand:+ start:803 stop:1018 length:216 start_codon:yes stop_codon:yes gene_type:complete
MVAKKRHIVKAISWRVIGTFDTVLLGWMISGDPVIGIKIGSVELVTKIILYYAHERAWYKLSNFGVDKVDK